jgi:hypothetical protein
MWYCGSAISVAHASNQRGGARSLERLTVKHPRAIRQGMSGVDFASLDGQPERSRTDLEDASGFVQIHPSFRDPSIAIVASDVVMGTERDDSFSGPAIPTPGEEPIPIQDVGEQIVGTNARQHTYCIDDVLRRVRGTLSPSSSRHSQFGMHAAFPMNDQNDLTGCGIGIDDDFVDEGSNEAFLQSDIRVRLPPDGLEVRSQILEFVAGWDHGLTAAVHVSIDALLDLADTLQRRIPASLQFVRDEAILRIGGVVLFVRSASRVPRRFQLPRPRLQDLILLVGRRLTGDDRGVDGSRLHDTEDFLADRVVYHESSERDATWFTVIARASDADVAQNVVRVASVTDDQFPPTPSAPQYSR